MCKCSKNHSSLQKMQIKPTMTYTVTNLPDGYFFLNDKNKFWRKCGAIRTYTYCQWEFKLMHLLWKTTVSAKAKQIPTLQPRIASLSCKPNKIECIFLPITHVQRCL